MATPAGSGWPPCRDGWRTQDVRIACLALGVALRYAISTIPTWRESSQADWTGLRVADGRNLAELPATCGVYRGGDRHRSRVAGSAFHRCLPTARSGKAF